MEVIADEAVTSLQAAFRLAAGGGASVLSLKPHRDGGLTASRRVAGVAAASGMGFYGGSELFGPLRLADDIVTSPLIPRDGTLRIPPGSGLGMTLDEDRVAFLARQREPGFRHLGAVA